MFVALFIVKAEESVYVGASYTTFLTKLVTFDVPVYVTVYALNIPRESLLDAPDGIVWLRVSHVWTYIPAAVSLLSILYKAVPEFQERWRKYPEQNWKSECPKAPNKLVGKDTRFKSHPKKVDLNSNIQESLVDLDIDISKVKLTE